MLFLHCMPPKLLPYVCIYSALHGPIRLCPVTTAREGRHLVRLISGLMSNGWHKMAAQGLLKEKVSGHPSTCSPSPWMRTLRTENSHDCLRVCDAEAEPRLPEVQPDQRGTQHHRKKQDINGFHISFETQIPPLCLPHPVFGAKLVSACAWLAPSHPFENPCLGHPSSLPQHAQ